MLKQFFLNVFYRIDFVHIDPKLLVLKLCSHQTKKDSNKKCIVAGCIFPFIRRAK